MKKLVLILLLCFIYQGISQHKLLKMSLSEAGNRVKSSQHEIQFTLGGVSSGVLKSNNKSHFIIGFWKPEEIKVGVAPHSTKEAYLKVFPNPSTGVFKIEFEQISDGKAELFINDITGRNVLNIDKSFFNKGNYISDLKLNLTPGVYFICLKTKYYTEMEKLIIM